MSYGLAGGGARYVTPRLPFPAATDITRAAPGVGPARAGLIVPPASLLWGSIPVDRVEGHEPEPAYDVRSSSGLGFVIPAPGSPWLGRYQRMPAKDHHCPENTSPIYEDFPPYGTYCAVPVARPPILSTGGSVPTGGTQPGVMNPEDTPRLASMFGNLGAYLPLLLVGGILLFALRR